jgi:hypothetical protein
MTSPFDGFSDYDLRDSSFASVLEGASKLGLPLPRGVFAQNPVATPKYTKQTPNGVREADFAETLARLFVQVGRQEYDKFLNSVAASGDSSAVALAKVLAGTNLGVGDGQGGAGYIDFILQSAQHNLAERKEVVPLLSNNYVVYYFGAEPPTFMYNGALINSKEDDQAHNMYRVYRDMIRGTQLARRRKLVALRYDNMIVRGTTDSMGWSISADNEMVCPFQFSLLVKTITLLPNPDAAIYPLSEPFAGSDVLPKMESADAVQTRSKMFRVTLVPPESNTAATSAEGTRAKVETTAATTPAFGRMDNWTQGSR